MLTPMSSRPPPSPSPPQRPGSPDLSRVVHRNIASLMELRDGARRARNISDRVADTITAFAGSMWCVCVHALGFGGWIILNSGWLPGLKPWDPFPFVMLAMIASVEAIFLSTFILITQNRMQRSADQRAELDLQISLLVEHELTRAVQMIDEIARRLQVARPPEEELDDIKKDINPKNVAEEIEKAERRLQ